jgi:putative DNA primase/helicase
MINVMLLEQHHVDVSTLCDKRGFTVMTTMSEDAVGTTACVDYTSGSNVVQLNRQKSTGFLLTTDEKGKRAKRPPSEAAKLVARVLRSKLAWDSYLCSWMWWENTHWAVQDFGSKAAFEIDGVIEDGVAPEGYGTKYLNEIIQLIQIKDLLPRPELAVGKVPFRNGMLDTRTSEILTAKPAYGMNWCLPYLYDASAKCPEITSWLNRCVGDDPDTVKLLMCWLAALIRGIPLQYFMMLVGAGGSGKGTFQRLAMALVGENNHVTTDLADLEGNRFEAARLVGKRLCLINEAGRHGGSVNALKALIGGDSIKVERKFIQSSGSFVFSGLVLMASNEQLQTTDSTSGIERRRITVRFPVAASADERWNWRERGGETQVLHTEIPGLINMLLEIPVSEIHRRFEVLPKAVLEENMAAMASSNNVADWLTSCTFPVVGAWTQIGIINMVRDPVHGTLRYEHEGSRLFPSYLAWCDATGRTRPVSLRKFRSTIVDIAVKMGHNVKSENSPVGNSAGILGLTLLDRTGREYSADDARRAWLKLGPREY